VSDASEAKRWRQWKKFDDGSIEIYPWNSSTGPDVPCFITAEDHDRIVAELEAKYKELSEFNDGCRKVRYRQEAELAELRNERSELKAEIEMLRYELNQLDGERKSAWMTVETHETTIARQAKVIEKLKGMVSHYETCATVDRYDDEEVPCDCGLEKELEAIEQGEGT